MTETDLKVNAKQQNNEENITDKDSANPKFD